MPRHGPLPDNDDWPARRAYETSWQRTLYDAGYAGLSWPAEFGGGGADAKIKAVFTEETDRAGAPERLNIIGEDFGGPTMQANPRAGRRPAISHGGSPVTATSSMATGANRGAGGGAGLKVVLLEVSIYRPDGGSGPV